MTNETQEVAPPEEVAPQPVAPPKEIAPPKSYATYPGAFYIDPVTKKTVRSISNKFIENQSYVAKSPIQGYGCFSKKDIKSGEMVEECSAIILDTTTKTNKDWVITQYLFTWPCDHEDPICKENGSTFFVPTGNALLYNHSDTPNTYWIYDRAMKRIFLAALRDISENEELTWYYGHGYAKKLRDGNDPSAGGCKPCQQKQRELEEKQKLKDALKIPSDENFTPPLINKELLNKWIEQKHKEGIVHSDPIEFRSMVVPEKKLDDNIQDNQI